MAGTEKLEGWKQCRQPWLMSHEFAVWDGCIHTDIL